MEQEIKQKDYLFTKKQRLLILLLGFLILAHIVASNFHWGTSIDNFYRPYSSIIFILVVTGPVAFLKKQNWKNKLRIIVLCFVLSFIIFNTYLHLGHLFDLKESVISAVDTSFDLQLVEAMVRWDIYYRIGKILLLDVFAIFTFVSINYTLNKIKD